MTSRRRADDDDGLPRGDTLTVLQEAAEALAANVDEGAKIVRRLEVMLGELAGDGEEVQRRAVPDRRRLPDRRRTG